jgi:hypothetical protein
VALVRVSDLHDLTEWWVEVPATGRFGLDGRHYEIDLCEEQAAALDQALAPYLAAAPGSAHQRSGGPSATLDLTGIRSVSRLRTPRSAGN